MDLFKDEIANFLDSLTSERGLSPHTIEAYGKDARRFALHLQGLGKSCFRDATADHFYSFLQLLKKERYATVNSIAATRGCPHKCDFCVVPTAWSNTYAHRPIGAPGRCKLRHGVEERVPAHQIHLVFARKRQR